MNKENNMELKSEYVEVEVLGYGLPLYNAIGSSGDGATTQRTEVRGDQSIAIGANTLAQGNSSIAIGNDDLNKVGGSTYTGAEKFIQYDESGNKTGEYILKGKALRDIYKEMTGDTMNYGAYTSTTSGEGHIPDHFRGIC